MQALIHHSMTLKERQDLFERQFGPMKPCPFCQSVGLDYLHDKDGFITSEVECLKCSARAWDMRWNDRTPIESGKESHMDYSDYRDIPKVKFNGKTTVDWMDIDFLLAMLRDLAGAVIKLEKTVEENKLVFQQCIDGTHKAYAEGYSDLNRRIDKTQKCFMKHIDESKSTIVNIDPFKNTSDISPVRAKNSIDANYNSEKLYESIRMSINSLSIENRSNTPDFILTEMLIGVLESVERLVRNRDSWYGKIQRPGQTNADTLLWAVYQDLGRMGIVTEKTYHDMEVYFRKGAADVKHSDSSGSEGCDVGKP